MNEKIDLKDRKLLCDLDFHSRKPNTQLAKKVGLSKQAVQYRINQLLKKGIIQGFYPLINMPKLGYVYCRLSLVLKDITEEEYLMVLQELKENKKIFWLFTTQGIRDLLLVTWARSIKEFQNTCEEMLIDYGKYIEKCDQNIITDVIHFQHRYLLNKKTTEEIHLQETSARVKIDRVDENIVKELCKDARMSLVEIARKIGISPRQALYRLKKMEKEKFILGYRPVIDHNKLGYTYFKLWINLHNFSRRELLAVKELLRNKPQVIYLVEGVAMPEILDVEIMVKSNQELQYFIQELRNKFPKNIGSYHSFMFLRTEKVKYYPF